MLLQNLKTDSLSLLKIIAQNFIGGSLIQKCINTYTSILALKYPFEQNGGTILILKHVIVPPKWILYLQKKITSQWLGIFLLISLIDSKTEIYFQKIKCIWNYFTFSKLTIETLEQCMKHGSSVFTVNFEHTSHLALLLLLTLSR